MPIETFPIGPLETNCHIVISGSDAVAVDPGGDLNSGLGEVLALLKEQNLTLRAILCTHFHFDHLYGVAALHEATGAPVYGPAGDASLLGTELGGAFTTACLYDIINTRLVRGLPTVMSTNLSAGELADRYGERIASRLFGEYTPLVFCGEDVRKEKIALR